MIMKASAYLYSCLFPEGKTGLFSTRTGAYLLLDREPARALLEGAVERLPEALIPELTRKGMLVPDGEDELALVLAARRFNGASFRILTTTGCNAACPYCYEKDLPKRSMDPETAEETADFLFRRRTQIGDNPLTLEWFGGEPLLNTAAIDRICRRLRDRDVPFLSRMTTNGALLQPEAVPYLQERWRLISVQITLDDVGSAHERSKGLPGGSFDRVVAGNAIHLLDDPLTALRELDRVCRDGGTLIIPTYMNKDSKENTGGFAGAVGKAGADFKRQFTAASYEQFFLDAGYPDVKISMADGRIPCAVAVMKRAAK